MIRINLLCEGTKPTALKSTGGRAAVATVVLSIAGAALLSFGTVGGLAWHSNAQIAKLEQRLKQEQAEQARLKAIQKENQLYQARVRELEQRIRAIQVVESSRSGSLELMRALGEAVNRTKGLYLLSVNPDGNRLLLKGLAQSVGALAGFITALKHSGSFSDVELRQYYQDDQADLTTFKFDLDCIYAPATLTGPGQPAARTVGITSNAGP